MLIIKYYDRALPVAVAPDYEGTLEELGDKIGRPWRIITQAEKPSAPPDQWFWTDEGPLSVAPAPVPVRSRADFVVALTKITPPILTEAEALAALEAFPPPFMAALADKPLPYRAAAIEAWRTTATVARDAPLFLDLLDFYAAQAGLNQAQAVALGDAIFAGAANG